MNTRGLPKIEVSEVRKKKESIREHTFFKIVFLLSLILYFYLPVLQLLNSSSLDLVGIIGTDNALANFLCFLIVCAIIGYLVYILLFNILAHILMSKDLSMIFDRSRVVSYFVFWYLVRNIIFGIISLIAVFYVPALFSCLFMFKAIITIGCVFMCFLDLRNWVFGSFFSYEIFIKISNLFIAYYLIYAIFELVEVV